MPEGVALAQLTKRFRRTSPSTDFASQQRGAHGERLPSDIEKDRMPARMIAMGLLSLVIASVVVIVIITLVLLWWR